METPMEVVRKLLTSKSFAEMNMDQRMDCFFVDYDFMPLVIQQNYIGAVQQEYVCLLFFQRCNLINNVYYKIIK